MAVRQVSSRADGSQASVESGRWQSDKCPPPIFNNRIAIIFILILSLSISATNEVIIIIFRALRIVISFKKIKKQILQLSIVNLKTYEISHD